MIDYDSNYRIDKSTYNRKRGQRIFRVARVITIDPKLFTYKLKTLKNEPVLGTFYGKELVRSNLKDLKVDKVLKTRKLRNGKIEHLVSFKDYDKYDTIPHSFPKNYINSCILIFQNI